MEEHVMCFRRSLKYIGKRVSFEATNKIPSFEEDTGIWGWRGGGSCESVHGSVSCRGRE
jgi:hypothetical protein